MAFYPKLQQRKYLASVKKFKNVIKSRNHMEVRAEPAELTSTFPNHSNVVLEAHYSEAFAICFANNVRV